jgi:hypothetical protein
MGVVEGPGERRDDRKPRDYRRPAQRGLGADPRPHAGHRRPAYFDAWPTSATPPVELLRPYPAEPAAAYPVSKLVNSRRMNIRGVLSRWRAPELMIEDPDVFRAAKLLIDQHGDGAALKAAHRGDELLEEGDPEGFAV